MSKRDAKAIFDARHPLESFDPRYRDLLRRALSSDIELRFDSIGKARHFQTRIQMYRKRLLDAKDPEARSFYRLKTSRKDNFLRIYAADAEFDELLAQFSDQNLIPESPEPEIISSGPSSTPIPEPAQDSESMTFDELFRDIPEPHSFDEDEPNTGDQ